jgi:hypothetical protein
MFPLQLCTRSIEPSFGLLFGDLLTELGVKTTGAALIMSTLDALINFSGLFVGPLIRAFSYRKVSIVGSALCALGLILTYPANSMAHILATYSIINGKTRAAAASPHGSNSSRSRFRSRFDRIVDVRRPQQLLREEAGAGRRSVPRRHRFRHDVDAASGEIPPGGFRLPRDDTDPGGVRVERDRRFGAAAAGQVALRLRDQGRRGGVPPGEAPRPSLVANENDRVCVFIAAENILLFRV